MSSNKKALVEMSPRIVLIYVAAFLGMLLTPLILKRQFGFDENIAFAVSIVVFWQILFWAVPGFMRTALGFTVWTMRSIAFGLLIYVGLTIIQSLF